MAIWNLSDLILGILIHELHVISIFWAQSLKNLIASNIRGENLQTFDHVLNES